MSERLAGLGITVDEARCSSITSTSKTATHPKYRTSRESSDARPSTSQPTLPALRSMTAMRGLLLAEVGDATVELDVCGNRSGFREGRRIVLEHVTPGGSTTLESVGKQLIGEQPLARHGTLLSDGAAPGRNAAELKSLLGNSRVRLKSGATVLPASASCERGPSGVQDLVVFEQAKTRARVEIDVVLESNVCVQGGYLKGQVEIGIRKRSKNESAIMLAEGKVRVVGFECIPNTDIRHTFYHCATLLSSVTDPSPELYASEADSEGFSEAKEGLHVVPFAMFLPIKCESGAKGVLHDHSGAKVRYIAMASIKVKDRDTNKRSIAHFYRNCEVWPRFNPSVILAPATRPLQASTSKKLFMGGSGRLSLSATLHRLHWIAGQQCCIHVFVKNDTRKTVKSLLLTLIRTTVIFRPRPHLDALPPAHEHLADPDACQTSTMQKQVAECTLHMGQHASRGYVSAKGWWTGVRPGETSSFSHFLSLPADSLSITRGRLLEVEYSIRVSLGTGSLASDAQVVLPIRIINFLSVDPPPSFPSCFQEDSASNSINGNISVPVQSRHRSRPIIEGLFPDDESSDSSLGDIFQQFDHQSPISDEELGVPPRSDSDQAMTCMDLHETDGDVEGDTFANAMLDSVDDGLGRLTLEDDSDEGVKNAIGSIRIGYGQEVNVARFSDLYYASFDEADLAPINAKRDESWDDLKPAPTSIENVSQLELTPRVFQISSGEVTAATCDREQLAVGCTNLQTSHIRQPGLSSFALRVQEKLQADGRPRFSLGTMDQVPKEDTPDRGPANEWGDKYSDATDSESKSEMEATHPRSSERTGTAVFQEGCTTASRAGQLPHGNSGSRCNSSDQSTTSIGIVCQPSGSLQGDQDAVDIGTSGKTPWQVTTVTTASMSMELGSLPQPTAARPEIECNEVSASFVQDGKNPSERGDGLAINIPINSVKAKIKELEERAKAAVVG